MKLLIIGARPQSLGAHVRSVAESATKLEVTTAGLHAEDLKVDLTKVAEVQPLIWKHGPWDHVVCTAGINLSGTISGEGWLASLESQMRTNYYGPMILLSQWTGYWRKHGMEEGVTRHYVAVSSNSAQVARSTSGGYCASKAALSMGIRCAAREMAEHPLAIWAVEPGWLTDTPMSRSVQTRLGEQAPHRIPSGESISPLSVAVQIVSGITRIGRALNGCILRIDGGEE